jgi:hypothetical protein
MRRNVGLEADNLRPLTESPTAQGSGPERRAGAWPENPHESLEFDWLAHDDGRPLDVSVKLTTVPVPIAAAKCLMSSSERAPRSTGDRRLRDFRAGQPHRRSAVP